MASFSRLFGLGSKKTSSSNMQSSSSNQSLQREQEQDQETADGFTLLAQTRSEQSAFKPGDAPGFQNPPSYQSVSGAAGGYQVAYQPQPVQTASPSTPGLYHQQQPQPQSTSSGFHFLDGVPFVLSAQCSSSSQLDTVMSAVDAVTDRIRGISWHECDYNFRLEKSVMESDLSGSLSNMTTSAS